jgi:hypothetical protein
MFLMAFGFPGEHSEYTPGSDPIVMVVSVPPVLPAPLSVRPFEIGISIPVQVAVPAGMLMVSPSLAAVIQAVTSASLAVNAYQDGLPPEHPEVVESRVKVLDVSVANARMSPASPPKMPV